MYFTEIILIQSYTYLYIGIFNVLLIMLIWSHLQATLNNPGTLPKNYRQLDPDLLPITLTNLIERVARKDEQKMESFVETMPDFAPVGVVQVKVNSYNSLD
jgi:hypothetical protein